MSQARLSICIAKNQDPSSDTPPWLRLALPSKDFDAEDLGELERQVVEGVRGVFREFKLQEGLKCTT